MKKFIKNIYKIYIARFLLLYALYFIKKYFYFFLKIKYIMKLTDEIEDIRRLEEELGHESIELFI